MYAADFFLDIFQIFFAYSAAVVGENNVDASVVILEGLEINPGFPAAFFFLEAVFDAVFHKGL